MVHTNKILQGDALEVLKTLPSESINCCVTSPPYWALRDYGVDGQLGLEPNFNDYINNLCNVFDEIKKIFSLYPEDELKDIIKSYKKQGAITEIRSGIYRFENKTQKEMVE